MFIIKTNITITITPQTMSSRLNGPKTSPKGRQLVIKYFLLSEQSKIDHHPTEQKQLSTKKCWNGFQSALPKKVSIERKPLRARVKNPNCSALNPLKQVRAGLQQWWAWWSSSSKDGQTIQLLKYPIPPLSFPLRDKKSDSRYLGNKMSITMAGAAGSLNIFTIYQMEPFGRHQWEPFGKLPNRQPEPLRRNTRQNISIAFSQPFTRWSTPSLKWRSLNRHPPRPWEDNMHFFHNLRTFATFSSATISFPRIAGCFLLKSWVIWSP